MSKRKSSAGPSPGPGASGRRPSVTDLRDRAANVIGRKRGTTNVRPTASYEVIRSHADMPRNSTVLSVRKSGILRNEMNKVPKTRFDLTSGRSIPHKPRLKHFPIESVTKTMGGSSNSTFSMLKFANRDIIKRSERPSSETDAVTNLQTRGYGDAPKLDPVEALAQQSRQRELLQQGSERAIAPSQRHVPAENDAGQLNRSEAILCEPVEPLVVRPVHGPFVPNTSHAMVPGDSLPQDSVMEQLSQLAGRPTAKQPHQGARSLLSKMIPWTIDESMNTYKHKVQPIAETSSTERPASPGPGEKSDVVHPTVATGQPATTPDYIPTNDYGKLQWEEECRRQPPEQQLYRQQEHNLYFSQRGLDTTRTSSNAPPSDYHIHNQMVQQHGIQRNESCQQRRMMTQQQQQQQQQRPLALQPQVPTLEAHKVDRTSFDETYNPSLICSGEQPTNMHRSRMNFPQDMNNRDASIPHHQMLMQQCNALQIGPQHRWVHDHKVVGDRPIVQNSSVSFAVDPVSPDRKCSLSNDSKQNGQFIRQQIAWQQAGVCRRHGIPHMRQEVATHAHRVDQHTHLRQNTRLSQCYPSVPEKSLTTPIDQRKSSHQEQQQLGMNNQFDRPEKRRRSLTVEKKYPQFTAEMIRDQELLVSNMRQQRIPENIMRRQFEALLGEQRRHLVFLRERETGEKIGEPLNRRNSRAIDGDERPDWMERITPARVTMQQPSTTPANANQQSAGGERESGIKRYDQMQLEISQETSNLGTPPRHLLPDTNTQERYQSWPPRVASQRYTIAGSPTSLTRVLLPTETNDSASDVLYSSSQPIDFQTKPHPQLRQQQQHQYQGQQQFQRRYQEQWEQQTRTQLGQSQRQEPFMDSQKIRDSEHMSVKRHQRRGEMMPDEHVRQRQYVCFNFKPTEPWSLLKMREFQRYVRPQKQNNGLQDAETVRTAFEALKNPGKGLEYFAHLEKKDTAFRLNGTQNPSELDKISPPPVEYLQRMQRQRQPKVSSNGLCNKRNANNPVPPPISYSKNIAQSSPAVGYPRQYDPYKKQKTYDMAQGSGKIPAEKEDGSTTTVEQCTGTVLPNYNRATTEQYSPIQFPAHCPTLPRKLGPDDGRDERVTASRNGRSTVKLQRPVPIMPYKLDYPIPQYQQQMEQLDRNRVNLETIGACNTARLPLGSNTPNGAVSVSPVVETPSTRNTLQSEAMDETCRQKVAPAAGEMLACGYRDVARMAQKEEAVTSLNRGQPEIQEPRTIGGLTYLARKVDYIQNSPLIAPNTFTSEAMARCGKRNYMDEMRDIICAIKNTKPEPEVCNARCPPLGCPKGPCVGMCCYQGACDPCCVSQMPCCPPSPEPPHCCIPACQSVSIARSPRTINRCSAMVPHPSPMFPRDQGIACTRCFAPRF